MSVAHRTDKNGDQGVGVMQLFQLPLQVSLPQTCFWIVELWGLGMDATLPLALRLWVLGVSVVFILPATCSMKYVSEQTLDATTEDPYTPYDYARFPEVEKHCSSFLSSAHNLEFDFNRANNLKKELSFVGGDWIQVSGDAPLMPFDPSDAPLGASDLPNPLYLVSFSMKHVDPLGNSHSSLKVSGALGLGISRNGTAPESVLYQFPEFRFWPGSSEFRIQFEGVYIELEKNGGERVLCLLGNALLPSRDTDSSHPWEWVKDASSTKYQHPHLQDDQILLVLHYPKVFTLTTRAVRGEMKSLNRPLSPRYFDEIQLSSRLGPYSNYEYGSEDLVSKACAPYPSGDDIVHNQLEVYKGAGFCGILYRFASRELLNIVPNWNCNSTDEYCRKLGPFVTEMAINATDGGFANVGLMMQDIRCEPRIDKNNMSLARVFTVFRAIPPWEDHYMVAPRTGLNGLTLSAEGIWNSSAGQLCMVGCLGLDNEKCQSRICLYVPTSFSISRRNIIYGRISSIEDNKDFSHFPLTFENPVHPSELRNKMNRNPFITYMYSKIKVAGAFLERSEPFDFGNIVKKSLLSYPRKGNDGDDDMANLSNLADALTLHVPVVPDPIPDVHKEKPFLQMEVLSIGSLLFGQYWTLSNASIASNQSIPPSKEDSTEKQLLLNVSAELILYGNLYTNVSLLYLEGLYNPIDGRMYLIGCRDVRASWNILFDSMDLEDGLDCLIEVKVEYPPTTARWLINPTAKFSITSQRNDDDPLHFDPLNLQTLPIFYKEQKEDILSRRDVEGILRIITLSLAILFILSQLFYIRDNGVVVPYISLVMLGVQALGYIIPLITGAEALYARITSESYENPSYEFKENQRFQFIDYMVKILVLGAFLLTLRLGQKVVKSRIRLLTRTPLEPGRVPSDKRILLISFSIHMVGFLGILIMHFVNVSRRPVHQTTYLDPSGNNHKLNEWEMLLEEYIGLLQDFFLLPQIIGNCLWQISCMPLKKTYYIGITMVRLLPHVYDFVRAPVFNPYFSDQYEFVDPNLDFFSKFGDIFIPVTAVVFVIVIYIQQRWNYDKLSQVLRSGQNRLLPSGSRVYDRLPSMSFEAELVAGVNETEIEKIPSEEEA
ncbi:hypothetical protein ZIOFF_008463 [Zingiber officinale]|uniref:RING-type E3 ubiquitin transferase n=2 Tax=Zingiber officinale TaxID=94328 RepID=A0A8J5I3F2_ZINOF|nr:hypothetical protein ZIOFF_008463 [Zingiber officinale]